MTREEVIATPMGALVYVYVQNKWRKALRSHVGKDHVRVEIKRRDYDPPGPELMQYRVEFKDVRPGTPEEFEKLREGAANNRLQEIEMMKTYIQQMFERHEKRYNEKKERFTTEYTRENGSVSGAMTSFAEELLQCEFTVSICRPYHRAITVQGQDPFEAMKELNDRLIEEQLRYRPRSSSSVLYNWLDTVDCEARVQLMGETRSYIRRVEALSQPYTFTIE